MKPREFQYQKIVPSLSSCPVSISAQHSNIPFGNERARAVFAFWRWVTGCFWGAGKFFIVFVAQFPNLRNWFANLGRNTSLFLKTYRDSLHSFLAVILIYLPLFITIFSESEREWASSLENTLSRIFWIVTLKEVGGWKEKENLTCSQSQCCALPMFVD